MNQDGGYPNQMTPRNNHGGPLGPQNASKTTPIKKKGIFKILLVGIAPVSVCGWDSSRLVGIAPILSLGPKGPLNLRARPAHSKLKPLSEGSQTAWAPRGL